MTELSPKHCTVCGRRITWRKKWRTHWDAVRYCSKACRHKKLDETDRQLEKGILSLLQQRGRKATICPGEAARTIAGSQDRDRWRALMPAARNAARRLHNMKKVVIMQKGSPVDPSTAKGPIRIKRRLSEGNSEFDGHRPD
jgi:hypothetical protein